MSDYVSSQTSSTSERADAAGRVRLSTIGYTPEARKRATLASPAPACAVVRADTGEPVWNGSADGPFRTAASDTDEQVWIADFSSLVAPGRYRFVTSLDTGSPGRDFEISEGVWNEAYRAVAKAMYLWRCGCAVETEWHGVRFAQTACHQEDGWLDHVGGGHVLRDGTGGWHDAGDYNKYVVNAGVTVGLMFKAWEHFRPRVEGLRLGLPESGNGVPDLLNELRWELDWLFKMQTPDGRVHHKLSARDFSYWGPAGVDKSPRYFSGWSTAATACFAAMMAVAARHFRAYDTGFAERCERAARLSWACLEAHPAPVRPEQSAFTTGGYECEDTSHRHWAAAELWATTGEAGFLAAAERGLAAAEFSFHGPTWGNVCDLALGAYIESARPGADAALRDRLRAQLLVRAAGIAHTADAHAHGRPLGGEASAWFWGCNGSVAAQTYLLHLADRLKPDPVYRRAAHDALAHLFGRNFHGRSYVTGLGAKPPRHPHDRRGDPAWPGYLVGGGWPTGRSWVDEREDYRQNEIAINWNGSLLYALAAFA